MNSKKYVDIFEKSRYICFYWDIEADELEISRNGIFDGIKYRSNNPLDMLLKNNMIHSEDVYLVEQFNNSILGENRNYDDIEKNIEFRIHKMDDKDDNSKWIHLTCVIDVDGDNNINIVAGYIYELSMREVKVLNIVRNYNTTSDTTAFIKCIEDTLVKYSDEKLAIIEFDIEKFKLVNEEYGEEFGTEVLNYMSSYITNICPNNYFSGRFGSDVFLVVTPFKKKEDIIEHIKCIDSNLSYYRGVSFRLCYGIYVVEDKKVPIRTMVDSAAIARQSLKGNALNNCSFYTEELKKHIKSDKFIEDNMNKALNNDEFKMYLQPKYNIEDNTVIGAEALVRWVSDEKGIIPPNEFIPLFEKNGFIAKMDEYMWEQACKALRRWIDLGIKVVPISINVSQNYIGDLGFIDRLNALLEKYNIQKNLLEIEITETVYNNNVQRAVYELKNNGFTLLMDDFGSGYSSLTMLKNTPFDIIKMDRGFLNELMLSEKGKKLIYHTILMSKDMGIDLIAEGVECEQEEKFLYKSGCTIAQGFYYSKPIPVEEFEEKYLINNKEKIMIK